MHPSAVHTQDETTNATTSPSEPQSVDLTSTEKKQLDQPQNKTDTELLECDSGFQGKLSYTIVICFTA